MVSISRAPSALKNSVPGGDSVLRPPPHCRAGGDLKTGKLGWQTFVSRQNRGQSGPIFFIGTITRSAASWGIRKILWTKLEIGLITMFPAFRYFPS